MDSSPNSISLLELQSGVKDALNVNFGSYLWVHAEISEINVNNSGHCYLELVEKDEFKILAKLRATIWSYTFRILKPYFESSTGYKFDSGIKVSLKVSLEYHEVYGLSLNVKDIDPTYTVGDIELQKQRIIQQLEADGVLEMNADLELPMVVQNIAVISSPSAAGWGDWLHQIDNNTHGYHFNYRLFEAQMQGEATTASVIGALEQIYQEEDAFEAVVLIRGGGSKTDLASFDTYDLAANLAQFPLPVITGIGHERDESIADIVAHTALKTPTAVADFLIDKMQAFENAIDDFANEIGSFAQNYLVEQKQKILMIQKDSVAIAKHIMNQQDQQLNYSAQHLKQWTKNYLREADADMNLKLEKIQSLSQAQFGEENEHLLQFQERLSQKAEQKLKEEAQKVAYFEKLNSAFDPMRILERGFAMVKQGEHFVKSETDYQKDKDLQIVLKDGQIDLKAPK